MNNKGKVEQLLESENGLGRAEVLIGRASACEKCAAHAVCGSGDVRIVAAYDKRAFPNLGVGDSVEIDLPTGGGLKAAALMYALPLALMFVGLAVGHFLNWPDWIGLAAGVIAMAIVYVFIYLNRHRFERNPEYMGTIVRILDLTDIQVCSE